MKLILRRAKDTSHFMLFETRTGKVGYIMYWPMLLVASSLLSIIGLDQVGEWWKPWVVIAVVMLVLYFIYKFREPWAGDKLPEVQAATID